MENIKLRAFNEISTQTAVFENGYSSQVNKNMHICVIDLIPSTAIYYMYTYESRNVLPYSRNMYNEIKCMMTEYLKYFHVTKTAL